MHTPRLGPGRVGDDETVAPVPRDASRLLGEEAGGEGGIRTLDGLPHTAFPVRRPRPLGDLSAGREQLLPDRVRVEGRWRRGRDSNPRCFRTPLFESGTINHSDTSPRESIAKASEAPGCEGRQEGRGDGPAARSGRRSAASWARIPDTTRKPSRILRRGSPAGRPSHRRPGPGRPARYTMPSASASSRAPTHIVHGSTTQNRVTPASDGRPSRRAASRMALTTACEVGSPRGLEARPATRHHRLIHHRDRTVGALAGRGGGRGLGQCGAHVQLVVHGSMLHAGEGPRWARDAPSDHAFRAARYDHDASRHAPRRPLYHPTRRGPPWPAPDASAS